MNVNMIFKFGYSFVKSSIQESELINGWNGHKDFELRWKKPGDENHTDIPALVLPLNSRRNTFYTYSERNIQSGSFIRIQDINISYPFDLGKNWNANLMMAVNNVGLIWRANNSNLDPESPYLPTSRIYSFGVNFKSK